MKLKTQSVHESETCLLNNPRKSFRFFILFEIHSQQLVKGCFWLLVILDLNY